MDVHEFSVRSQMVVWGHTQCGRTPIWLLFVSCQLPYLLHSGSMSISPVRKLTLCRCQSGFHWNAILQMGFVKMSFSNRATHHNAISSIYSQSNEFCPVFLDELTKIRHARSLSVLLGCGCRQQCGAITELWPPRIRKDGTNAVVHPPHATALSRWGQLAAELHEDIRARAWWGWWRAMELEEATAAWGGCGGAEGGRWCESLGRTPAWKLEKAGGTGGDAGAWVVLLCFCLNPWQVQFHQLKLQKRAKLNKWIKKGWNGILASSYHLRVAF